MRKRRFLILDCTTNKEPREGSLIKDLLEICKLYKPARAASLMYKIKSKKDFLQKLKTQTKYDIIHISAHGSPEGIGNGSTWEVETKEIAETNPPRYKAKLVHVSACVSNRKGMAEAFNSKYFIAPDTDVDWVDAAIFSSLLYKRYIVDGYSLPKAFQYARRKTETCIDYPVYWE